MRKLIIAFIAVAALGLFLDLPSVVVTFFEPGFEAWTPPSERAAARPLQPREPCAHRDPGRRAFFGDLHVHTAFSMDTVIRGGTSTPDEAYRFARGEAILLPPSRPFSLARPLDFAAVTDHAEWLGETSLCTRADSPVYDSNSCKTFRGEQPSSMGNSLFGRIFALVGIFGRARDICGEDARACRDALVGSWQETQAAAERHYDRSAACSFTTFHAWEYSASPGRSKVHRNVILRNEIVPELPISWIDEPTALGFWRKLRAQCNDSGSGCEALAIPHNPNVSNGQMFSLDINGTIDEQRSRARLRASLEPLVEMTQAKGESECRGGFAGVLGQDELCEEEKIRWIDGVAPPDCGDETATGAMMNRGCQSRRDFARYVLIDGLREQERLGFNPYKLGWIGGTDTHNGTPGATDEASYPGHNGITDATLAQRIGTEVDNYAPYPLRNPGGLVGIWAEENSRNALFDAMKRRETFATSGTRIVPRLFGSWDLPSDLCERADGATTADSRGVAMGGVLPRRPADANAPMLWISALADTRGGQPLQRVQIVKGWTSDDNLFHQRVFDVAGFDADEADVDRKTCAVSGPGASALCGTWSDPDFDPDRSAVYYARVLENPSCRWNALQCNAIAEDKRPPECGDASLPWRTQERAWTSAIWYEPTATN